MNQRFVHVVNFWLKKGLSPEQIRQFEAGLRSLGDIRGVSFFHMGTPAPTHRPVIDRSYDYCLVCVFDRMEDHDAYQVDPLHDVFRDTCSPLWDRVLIYDSLSV